MTADPDAPDDIPPWDLSVILEASKDHSFSTRFYELALDDVSSRGMVEKTSTVPDHMGITDEGIRHVEGELDNPSSFTSSIHRNRDIENQSFVPASDRFVELDHNQPAYKKALDAIDELVTALEQSNSYPGDDLLDRERRIGELKAGRRLLSAIRIDTQNLRAVVYGTLAYIVTAFANEPIGELAKNAWEAVKTATGI